MEALGRKALQSLASTIPAPRRRAGERSRLDEKSGRLIGFSRSALVAGRAEAAYPPDGDALFGTAVKSSRGKSRSSCEYFADWPGLTSARLHGAKDAKAFQAILRGTHELRRERIAAGTTAFYLRIQRLAMTGESMAEG